MADPDLQRVAHSQTTLDRGPDFVKLAEAYGIARLSCHQSGGVRRRPSRLRWTLVTAAVIDCVLDMDEMVHPMVNGGSPVTQFLLD